MEQKYTTPILQKDDPILREIAEIIPIEKIDSKEIKELIAKMSKAMHGEEDGVAIAAPQIGESKRIFLVNTKALINISGGQADSHLDDMVFINPVVKKLSRTKKFMEEGCLSVRWLYGKVERSEKATVVAFNEKGEKFEMGASGLLAQIFQHEIDHLDGKLFIDNARDIEDLPPNERK